MLCGGDHVDGLVVVWRVEALSHHVQGPEDSETHGAFVFLLRTRQCMGSLRLLTAVVAGGHLLAPVLGGSAWGLPRCDSTTTF